MVEVVKANMGKIKGCQKQQQTMDPSITGKMIVSWDIQPGGRPANIKVETASFQGTFVAGCIKGVVEEFSFPKFSGDPIHINFPFKL